MFAKFLAHSGCSVNGSNYYHYDSYHYYLLVVGVCQWQSSGKSSFVGTAFLLLSAHFPLLSTHYLLWGDTAHNPDKTNPKPQSGHCHGVKPPGKHVDGDVWRRAELPLVGQTKQVKHLGNWLTYWIESKYTVSVVLHYLKSYYLIGGSISVK